jgi:hypothetical protein
MCVRGQCANVMSVVVGFPRSRHGRLADRSHTLGTNDMAAR